MSAILTKEEANNITLSSLHLRNSNDVGIDEVVDSLIGLHSSRYKSPVFSVLSRSNVDDIEEIHNSIYGSEKFIRRRCMRGTLHVLNYNDSIIAHKVTLEQRLKTCSYLRKIHNLDDIEYANIRSEILSIIQDFPLRVDEIRLYFEKTKKIGVKVNLVLRILFEEGLIKRGHLMKDIWNEYPLYFYNKDAKWFEAISNISLLEAQRQLIIKYYKSYGPATIDDASWWSGIGKTIIKKVIHNSLDIVQIKIRKSNNIYYLHNKSLLLLPPASDNILFAKILPYEDNLLKGYSISRHRFMDAKQYKLVYNRAGEANATILVNGIIGGTWKLNLEDRRIYIYPFTSNRKIRDLIEQEFIKLAQIIDMGYTITK